METIDFGEIVKVLGGGWLSIAVAAVLVLIFAYLKVAEKRAKREQVKKETAKNRAKDQAEVPEHNQEIQDKWDEAGDDIDEIRKKFKEEETNDND